MGMVWHGGHRMGVMPWRVYHGDRTEGVTLRRGTLAAEHRRMILQALSKLRLVEVVRG